MAVDGNDKSALTADSAAGIHLSENIFKGMDRRFHSPKHPSPLIRPVHQFPEPAKQLSPDAIGIPGQIHIRLPPSARIVQGDELWYQ
jgi:hypothetical protein